MGILPPKPPKQSVQTKRKLSTEEKAEAFEKWMIKEGLLKYVDGQLTMCGNYVSLENAKKLFEESLTKPF